MSSDLLIWETKARNWGLSFGAAVGIAVCFGLLFDNILLGLAFFLPLAIAFSAIGEKRSARIADGTFTYDIGHGDGPVSVRVDQVASIEQKADGDLYFTLVDGTDAVISSGGDKEGVAAFVDKAKPLIGDHGQRFLD